MFKKLKGKIQKIRLNRKLRKLFPKLSTITKLDGNIKYYMNQKTLDKIHSVVPEEKLAVYNMIVVPDDMLSYGEVFQVQTPKNPEPVEIIYAPVSPVWRS